MQLSLFDAAQVKPIARKADPATSKISADAVKPKLAGIKKEFIDLLRNRGCPSTANEVASECNDPKRHESIRKRGRELVRDYKLVECGIKRCEYSGELAATFWLRND